MFSLIVGLVGGFVLAYLLYLYGRSRQFHWVLMTDESIVTASASEDQALRMTYEGVELRSPRLVRLRIANDGQTAIKEDDFRQPITLRYPGSQIYGLKVTACSATLTPEVQSSGIDGAVISPLLMNRKEWLEVQFVADGPQAQPDLSTRFVDQSTERGIDELKEQNFEAMPFLKSYQKGLIALYFLLVTLWVAYENPDPPRQPLLSQTRIVSDWVAGLSWAILYGFFMVRAFSIVPFEVRRFRRRRIVRYDANRSGRKRVTNE